MDSVVNVHYRSSCALHNNYFGWYILYILNILTDCTTLPFINYYYYINCTWFEKVLCH